MTVFTDDDLKALKSALKINATATLSPEYGLALLARLEAAEKCADEHARAFPNCPFVEAWREAAGK